MRCITNWDFKLRVQKYNILFGKRLHFVSLIADNKSDYFFETWSIIDKKWLDRYKPFVQTQF